MSHYQRYSCFRTLELRLRFSRAHRRRGGLLPPLLVGLARPDGPDALQAPPFVNRLSANQQTP